MPLLLPSVATAEDPESTSMRQIRSLGLGFQVVSGISESQVIELLPSDPEEYESEGDAELTEMLRNLETTWEESASSYSPAIPAPTNSSASNLIRDLPFPDPLPMHAAISSTPSSPPSSSSVPQSGDEDHNVNIVDPIEVLTEAAVQWVITYPMEAVRFSLEGNESNFVAMRAVSSQIAQMIRLEDPRLRRVIYVFAAALPHVCNMVLDDGGCLNLQYIATILVTLSAVEPTYWTSNPEARGLVEDAFPRLYAWIVILSDLVALNRFPIHGGHGRFRALCIINNTMWIMRNVGYVGLRFLENHSVWNQVLSMWCRTGDCSLQEEDWLALNFNLAKDLFALDARTRSGPGFLRTVLGKMAESRLDVGEIMSMSLSRVHRALSQGDGPEASTFMHQHLVIVLNLIEDDEEFTADESPFSQAFLSQKGLTFILETLTWCAGTSRWNGVDICIVIVVAFLRRTHSQTAFALALRSKLIRRLIQVSCYTSHLSAQGRDGISFVVSRFLPEILLFRTMTLLAVDLEPSDHESRVDIARSPYSDEWGHLAYIHRSLFDAYLELERRKGHNYERCGNPACNSIHCNERRHQRCKNCRMHAYCSIACQRQAWRNHGHRRGCTVLKNAQAVLRMEPVDLHFLLLLAQGDVQAYVDRKRIKEDNSTSFRLSYNLQFASDAPLQVNSPAATTFRPIIEEYSYDGLGVEGQILPSVPAHPKDASNFSAIVKLTFMRNFEQHSLLFLGRFKVGQESINLDD